MAPLRRMLATLAIVALVLFSAAWPATAAPASVSTNITIVAVDEATGQGVLVGLRVSIGPGTGQVKVIAGKVGPTTRYSLIQAAVTGTILAGKDWRRYNYEFRFLNASSVQGPSASAAAAVAVYLLMTGSPLMAVFNRSVVMTGAITPVGLVSAVGGIMEKCQAAAGAGRLFLYPAANYMESIPGCSGRNESVAGILGAVEAIEGVGASVKAPSIEMPEGFREGMVNASLYMAGLARRVLDSLRSSGVKLNTSPVYIEAVKAIDESNKTRSTLPYVSASKAFYALYTAYTLYYLSHLNSTQGFQDFIESEAQALKENLTRLEEKLSEMPATGSSYYVEFLGTAYARIADALSELEKINVVAEASPLEAVRTLAYARARIYSIESWVSTAKLVQNVEPRLNESMVRSLAGVAGDFVHIAADYSASIVSYMITQYNKSIDKRLLQSSLEALTMVIHRGDSYLSEGNYIAALGFYREALSQSMNSVFSVIISNYTVNKIYRMYFNETIRLYALIAAGLVWKGLPPGLAPAYMEYALYEAGKGDFQGAVDLARSALASALVWELYSVASSGPQPSEEGSSLLQAVPGTPEERLAIAVVAGLAGFVGALVVLGSLYRRALEKALPPA